MRYSGEENIAKKKFFPTDVAICFTCKIFVAITYTLVGRIIVCLFYLICLFSLDKSYFGLLIMIDIN